MLIKKRYLKNFIYKYYINQRNINNNKKKKKFIINNKKKY